MPLGHISNTALAPEVEIPCAKYGESDEPDYVPTIEQPIWAGKLKRKVRKLFFLQIDMQHKMYEAHAAEKMSHRRQVAMMIKVGLGGSKWF